MDHVPLALDEEIALEGLDGITLESLWFRLSERLLLPLPFNEIFKINLWIIILKKDHFDFFEIEEPRKTVGRLDRISFLKNEESAIQEVNDSYYIYTYHPIDEKDIRGSCKEYHTRKKVSRRDLKGMKFSEVVSNFGNKLVIVASQKLRNNVLMPSNIGRDCEINNYTYCILERIGRSRYFGETTSGPFSLFDFVKNSKLLHYFRSCLVKNNLVIRQQITQRIKGKSVVTQIFHLPKYYIVVKTSELIQVERLFAFLLNRPGHLATIEEVRVFMNVKSSKRLANIMKARHEVFEYRKFPYREVYPNAEKKDYAFKSGQEKTIMAVKLFDPKMDIFRMYEKEDKEPAYEEINAGFLDCSQQQLRTPLVHQVVSAIINSGSRGMSQTEVGKYFGLSKLNARSILRKIKKYDIQTYMRDEGRQRTTIFMSKNYANEKSKNIVDQVAKLFKKAEEKASQSLAQVIYDNAQNEQPEESILIPKIESNVSPTIVSIPLATLNEENITNKKLLPLSFLKPEMSTDNVIQYVQPQTPELKLDKTEDNTMVVLMPNDDYSFVDNVENVEVSLKFLNNIPGLQKQRRGLHEDLIRNRVSEKVLTRMNIILDSIKEKTVMDTVSLLIAVRQTEANFSEIICRKSILALCARLAADNFIKVIEMELTSPTKSVKLLFFGEPNITFDLRCWHSIIEEQKIQHFISLTRSMTESENIIETKEEEQTVEDMSIISKTSISCDEFSAQSTMHENFPKFMKYRLFHEFLYYLIYGYPENVEKIQVKRAIEVWRRENQRLTDYDEIAEKISICYSTDINWKMFIPPLNPQIGYESGWALLRDIIHRIPLILYVKFTRYGHLAPELNEYLTHPIKSNYLLHFLPPKMFSQLTQGRRYVLVISDLCRRLCMMGLLQFGPMRTKEIDQTYIYLNRNAMLLDTRSSSPGYLEVSEKEYQKLSFHFDSSEVVSNYWTSMYEVCVNTRINQKSLAFGKTIILEPLHTKPDLVIALKPQTAVSAPLNDIGEIPGDRRGAGGLDKAFMSHLKQSWSRSIDSKKRPISALSLDRKPKVKASKKEKIKPEPRKKKSAKVKAAIKEVQKSKAILQSNFKGVSSKSKIIRKVKPKRQTVKELKKKSELYDEVDKEALKLMKTLRVAWSEVEDKTLLLAKVALKFAFPSDNQCAHYIDCGLFRDILHWRTEKALNKTSKACQRRIVYLMKNNKTFREQTILYLEEVRANREFSSKYSNFAERLKKLYNQEEIYLVMKVHIVEMVHRMHQIFLKQYITHPVDISCNTDETIIKLPTTYDKLSLNYQILNPSISLDDSRYQEPTNPNDIQISILSSLIHSAVCSTNDKISNSFFLQETYSKFTDENLGAAVNVLRRLAVISLNKNQRSKKPTMPRTISPFHLSNRYALQIMSIHVPVELYDEYLIAVHEISGLKNSYQMKSINCGWIVMITEMLNAKKIILKTEKNDKTLKVDSTIRRKTNFEKISDNYMMMIKSKEEQKSIDQKIKTVHFQPDSNSDEKFIYNDDPIEIFCKLDTFYLHIFCILQALEHREEIKINDWKLIDSDKCSLKNCVIRSGDNFSIEVEKIACHGYDIIKYILSNSDQGPSNYDENLITKFNLIKFYDSVIKKYNEENALNVRKDHGKIDSTEMRQVISTVFLLKNIQRIATEVDNGDGAWLSEYKKISLYKTEEEVFYDEEETENPKIRSKSSNQANSNLCKTSDSFIVNLSSLYIVANNETDKVVTLDGDEYNDCFVPFDGDTRTKILEDIKTNQHIWMPKDFQHVSLENKLKDSEFNLSKNDKKQMKEICQFLKSMNQIGSNASNLLKKFNKIDENRLHEYLKILSKLKFILITGVNELRFIHKDYAAFWLIDTFYLAAKDSDEAIEPMTKKQKLENITSIDNNVNTELEQEKSEMKDDAGSDPTEDFEKKYKRNPFFLLPCPWIRVGSLSRTLNRRCFDKWLGTVFNYLSVNSGILLSDLCTKFNVITPVNIRNLCEILELIGCIKMMAYSKLEVSIYSEYDSNDSEIHPATFLDPFDRTFIEVNPDGFQRLTFFIGKKKYKLPFI